MKKSKNIGASNFRKLLELARKNNMDFNLLLKRYLQERFLYRLSISRYKENFILKGGLLLITIDIPASRPTMDIDFLTHRLDKNKIISAFKEILSVEYNDGVSFDSETLRSETIDKDGAYQGVRIKFKAYFNTSRNDMSIDLGLGDYVLNPREVIFPTILNDESPVLSAYSLETIIAEKLEAMAKLLYANSRLKDFYDVYAIFNAHLLNEENLAKSIKGTFENRRTPLKDLKIIFSPEFYSFAEKQIQWTAFLNKNKILNAPSEFKDIVMEIEKQIKHVLNNL